MLDALRGLGWTVPVAVLVPNALWVLLPRAAPPAQSPTPPSWVRWVEPVEWVGRAVVVIIPVFYRFRLATVASMLAGEVMLLVLAFYDAGWVRYFTRGRTLVLLYKPLFGVPLPLAVSPVGYFLAAAVVMGSMSLAAADVVFGAAHLAISRFSLAGGIAAVILVETSARSGGPHLVGRAKSRASSAATYATGWPQGERWR